MLSGVVAQLLGYIFGFIASTTFSTATGPEEYIVTISVAAGAASIVATCIYLLFSDISARKVVPWYALLGLLGLVFSLGYISILADDIFGVRRFSQHKPNGFFILLIAYVTGLLILHIRGLRQSESGTFTSDRSSQQQAEEEGDPAYKHVPRSPADQSSSPASNHEKTANEGQVATDQSTDDDEFNLGDFPKAQMAIEYRSDVMDAWTKTRALPIPFQRRFMESLESDPRSDPQKLAASLEEEFKKQQRPFDDDAANDALEEVRTISPAAVVEFKNVYETLGGTVPVLKILERIEATHGPSKRTIALEQPIKLKEEKQKKDTTDLYYFIGIIVALLMLAMAIS